MYLSRVFCIKNLHFAWLTGGSHLFFRQRIRLPSVVEFEGEVFFVVLIKKIIQLHQMANAILHNGWIVIIP